MPTEIYLVKVGMSMTEGVVEEWCVPDGGTVQKGELLYRLETEKVNLDVDADASGTVKHLVAEGVTMKPGDVVGYIYAPGEAVPDQLPASAGAAIGDVPALKSAPAAAPDLVAADRPAAAPATTGEGGRLLASPAARRLAREFEVELSAIAGSGPGGRIVEADVQAAADTASQAARPAPTSPIARRLARELGVDLAEVVGSGPGGRITKEDVEKAAKAARPAPAAPAAPETAYAGVGDRTVPVRGMRRTIAARMHESLHTMAQLTMNMDVVMDDAVRLRTQLVDEWRDDGIKPGYTDLVIRAAAKALEQHPQMNATFSDKEIVLLGQVNVGMAVALEDGLIVPVVKHANRLGIRDLSVETARLAAAARDGALGIDDLQGGTFTVTALGMFGVDSFTPIVNSPQIGILGVNRIRDDIAWQGNTPVKQQRMTLSLTWDHRAIDGAPAAKFLATIRDLLESPYRLLV
jgi:pyruvate/2-oxoglutarate dehydrogenase complex dihydrolipoamide acyltransferase (E2) component